VVAVMDEQDLIWGGEVGGGTSVVTQAGLIVLLRFNPLEPIK
jgi:hypothetical protein